MTTKTKAIVYMIISSFLFTTMNLLGKFSINLSIYQKAFISNFTALIIISIIIIKNKISFFGCKVNRKYLIARGICGALSLLCTYYTLENMILSDATLLTKLAPFFATIFGIFLLKDKSNKKHLILLFITLIGAVFVIKPNLSIRFIPSLIGILGASSAGFAFTMIRRIGNKENKFTIIFYNVFCINLVSFPFIFFHTENYINTSSIVYSVIAGICVSFAQIFLTLAYKNSPAASIAIYDYTGLIVSAIYGFIFFKEYPDLFSIIGYIIIITSSVLNFFVLKKEAESN